MYWVLLSVVFTVLVTLSFLIYHTKPYSFESDIHSEPQIVETQEIDVCYFVKSKTDNEVAERAVMRTWGTGETYFIKTNQTGMKHSDRFFYVLDPDFEETYQNLASKTMDFWKRIGSREDFKKKCKWFFLTDDDVYVNTKLVSAYLQYLDHEREMYLGLQTYFFINHWPLAQGHDIILSRGLVEHITPLITRCMDNWDLFHNIEDGILAACLRMHGHVPQFISPMENVYQKRYTYISNNQTAFEERLLALKDYSCQLIYCCAKEPRLLHMIHVRSRTRQKRSSTECMREWLSDMKPNYMPNNKFPKGPYEFGRGIYQEILNSVEKSSKVPKTRNLKTFLKKQRKERKINRRRSSKSKGKT